jgi:hypothetical protein
MTPVEKLALIRRALGLHLPLYEMKVMLFVTSLINGRDGTAWPSRRHVADGCGIDQRNAGRALQALVRRDLLTVVSPGGRASSARYTVNAEAIEAACEAAPEAASDAPRWCLGRRRGGVCRDARVASVETPQVASVETPKEQAKRKRSATKSKPRTRASGNGCAGAAPPPRALRGRLIV